MTAAGIAIQWQQLGQPDVNCMWGINEHLLWDVFLHQTLV